MGTDDASSADMNRASASDPDLLALDDEAVERLVAGDLPPELAPPGYGAVAELLAATRAAPTAEELAGEAAALAELKAVAAARSATDRSRRARSQGRRRRVGLAVVVVVGALAAGGAAAAAGGHLPGPVRDATRRILVIAEAAKPATPTQPRGQPDPVTRSPAAGSRATGTQATPSFGAIDPAPGSTTTGPPAGLDRAGLCQAYLAGNGTERGKKLDAVAFQALREAAGGANRIAAYCKNRQPGETQPNNQQHQAPPDDHRQAQDGPPSSTSGGQGQDGPPPTTGGSGPSEGGQ
jgi:hypothetical protein